MVVLMSRSAIYQWVKEKAIKPETVDDALIVAGERASPQTWAPFIRKLLWVLGSLALVAAMLFFMAYNWQAMGPMFKFGILQVSLPLVLVLYWVWTAVLVRRHQFSQQTIDFGLAIFHVIFALLIGGLLALFGQVYQTGADPWQLFAIWSLLISLMVMSSGQAVMWVFWSVLINIALALYVDTYPFWLMNWGIEQAIWLFLCVNVVLWLMMNFVNSPYIRSVDRLKRYHVSPKWAIHIQAMAVLMCLTYMGMLTVLEWPVHGFGLGVVTVLGLAAIFGYYRFLQLDFMILALWALAIMTLLVTGVIKITDGWLSGYLPFWLAIIIIGMTAMTVKWLKSLRQKATH